MSAIAGSTSDSSKEQLERMLAKMRHRGPDGEKKHYVPGISLGYLHLDTDSSPAARSSQSADGNLVIVMDGAIFNAADLRQEIGLRDEDSGHDGDPALVMHLYSRFGADAVAKLRGMFAIAIWNQSERSLFLARDQMGQKPLFFLENQGSFAFASEIKALLATGITTPRPDYNAIWHYMSLRFLPDQYTFFEGVRKLPAATWLLYRSGHITTQRYWNPDFTSKLSIDESEATDQLDSLIASAVRGQISGARAPGSFLSGGIDSGLVTALMAQAQEQPFPTFSIGVKEQKINELPYARMVSQKYGLIGRETIVEADLVRLMPTMVYHLDEPSDPFGVGVYLVAREAAKECKVVLSGDGGDENFAGYDRFAGQRLVDYYAWLPVSLRRHLIGHLINLVPESFGYKSLASKLKWMHSMSFHDAGHRYAASMAFLRFTEEHKQELFSEATLRALKDSDSTDKILCHFNADNANEMIDRMLYTDLMTRMPDHLLAISDRMTMAHSIEARPPLIDHGITEFAASLPGSYKLKGRSLKHILKLVAERHLPHELIYRPKQGFGFPLATWLRTDLKGFTRSLLLDQSRFVANGTFRADYVKHLVEEHIQGKADHNFRLWILINLEIWHRIYLENESPDSLQPLIESLLAQPSDN